VFIPDTKDTKQLAGNKNFNAEGAEKKEDAEAFLKDDLHSGYVNYAGSL
jgi:hypothetical protein